MAGARKIIVGDIHGCHTELMDLLSKVGYGADDELIALGDIVDRGPDSPGVVGFFRSDCRARSVLGNHERKHLRWSNGQLAPALSQRIAREQFGGDAYAGALDYFGTLPLFIDLPEALLAHGSYEAGVPLERQRVTVLAGTLTGEQHIRESCDRPWYELYDGPRPIVVGHLDYLGGGVPMIYKERVFAIDTGCCRGGRLTALVLPQFEIVSVASRTDYWSEQRRLHAAREREQVSGHSPWAAVEACVTSPADSRPEDGRREVLRGLLTAAVPAAEAIRDHVQAAADEMVDQLSRDHGFARLGPAEQARLFAATVGRTPLAPLLHLARKGQLDTESVKRKTQSPARALALAAELGLLGEGEPCPAGRRGDEDEGSSA